MNCEPGRPIPSVAGAVPDPCVAHAGLALLPVTSGESPASLLSLDKIRSTLNRLEDTIIFRSSSPWRSREGL